MFDSELRYAQVANMFRGNGSEEGVAMLTLKRLTEVA